MKEGTGDSLWDEDGNEDSGEEATSTQEQGQSNRADDNGEQLGTPDEMEARNEAAESTLTSNQGGRPYIVERAVKGKSTQWRREERLTFFVRDRVAQGERQLTTVVEDTLNREVPVFDIREAAYLVAQENPEQVITKLCEMGYEPNKK